ncbi:MAG: hypothetical protein ACRC1W_10480, partial [Shewanella sp.]
MMRMAISLLLLAPQCVIAATTLELEQQLETLRQQLILQNRALHDIQGQLEATKSQQNSVGQAGDVGSADSSTAVQRSPSTGRSTEDFLLENHTVFDRKWVFDLGVSYQHYDRKDLALRGFLALDAIFLGVIN